MTYGVGTEPHVRFRDINPACIEALQRKTQFFGKLTNFKLVAVWKQDRSITSEPTY